MAGVGGRGAMYADGVFGGSKFGITFFQESMNFESPAVSAGRSVENWRHHLDDAAEARLRRIRGPCRNILRRSSAFVCCVRHRERVFGKMEEEEEERVSAFILLGLIRFNNIRPRLFRPRF